MQVQGEWVHTPPDIDLTLQPPEQSGASEAVFYVSAGNRSESEVNVHWDVAGLDTNCIVTCEPLQSTIPAGDTCQIKVKIRSTTPSSNTAPSAHVFSVIARLTGAPQLFWQVAGKWNQLPQQSSSPLRPVTPPADKIKLQPAPPTVSKARRFWGCAVMLFGVAATIAFGILVGNIVFDVFRLSDNETWVVVVIAWVIGVLVTRGIARKILKR